MKRSYIACVAGKSGGHIIPCFSYARQVKTPEQSILFFSNNTPLDCALIEGQDDVFLHQPLSLNARRSWKTVFHFLKAIIVACKKLRKYRPTKVISTGGIVSLPVFIAAWLLRIECVLFELNAVPGTASRWCAPFATKIHVCFKQAASYFSAKKTVITAYPLRPEVKQAVTYKKSGDAVLKTLLILGGSQGSVSINSLIKELCIAQPFLKNTLSIIHQTGSNDQTDWASFYTDYGITAYVFAFEENLIPYYQQADLIIARAGAGTLFEIIAFKKHSIIIPLETVQTDHQLDNAYAIAQEHPDFFTVLREKKIKTDLGLLWKAINKKIESH